MPLDTSHVAVLSRSTGLRGRSAHRPWRVSKPGCHTAVMVMQDVSELGTILSIWAHPDDEAYLCGGIMAMATAAGSRQTGHPDHIAVHHWTLEAVRRTGIGALHVAVNTQESLDQNLARFVELGIIVGEQPVAWLDPLSIQLDLETAVLERKLACPCRSGKPNPGLPHGGRGGRLPSGGRHRTVRSCGAAVVASLAGGRAPVRADCYS